MWRVTLPTAALPGYTASNVKCAMPQPPPGDAVEVAVNDELARSARPGFATVMLTPELNTLPEELEAMDSKV